MRIKKGTDMRDDDRGHSDRDTGPGNVEGFSSEAGLGVTPPHQGMINDPSERDHDED